MRQLRTRYASRAILIIAALTFGCKSNDSVDDLVGNRDVIEVEVPQDLQVTITTPAADGKKAGYSVYLAGSCTLAGATVEFRNGATGFATCQVGNTWEAEVDISGAAVGNVSIDVVLVDGSEESGAATRVVNKDNSDCDSVSARAATFAGGDGLAPASAYLICTPAQFNNIRNFITRHFLIRNDLLFDSSAFVPIVANFSGSLDGDGFVIRDLYIYDPTNSNVAIFKGASEGTSFTNIEFENPRVTGNGVVGILLARVANAGAGAVTVSDITINNGQITAAGNWVGAVVGHAETTTAINFSDITVTNTSLTTAAGYIGMVLGGTSDTAAAMTLTDIEVDGSITYSGSYGGGAVGIIDSTATFTNITSTVDISNTAGTADNFLGGIVGRFDLGNINTCEYSGNIIASSHYVGGAVGSFRATNLQDCTVAAVIVVDSTNRAAGYVGGVVGISEAATPVLTNITSTVDITVSGTNVSSYYGGIAGYFRGVSVTNSTADGDTVAGTPGTINISAGDGATTGSNNVGGAFGRIQLDNSGVDMTVSNVTANVDVTNSGANANAYVGGFVGYAYINDNVTLQTDLSIINSSSTGDVIANNKNIGGFAGVIYAARHGSEVSLNDLQSSGDVTVGSLNAQTTQYIGGFAGNISSRDNNDVGYNPTGGIEIDDCTASGDVLVDSGAVGGNYIGGFAGYYQTGRSNLGGGITLASDFSASGTVTALSTVTDISQVGGLIGYIYASANSTMTIDDSLGTVVSTGAVYADGQHVGGLFGRVYGNTNGNIILDDLFTSVSVTGRQQVGGLIGRFDSTNDADLVLTDSYSNGDVLGQATVGGLIGLVSNGGGTATMQIDNVKSHDSNILTTAPTVTGTNLSGTTVGGLIGSAASTTASFLLSDCEADSVVTSSGNYAGGLIGYDGANVDITNCTAKGSVTATLSTNNGYVGGLTGGSDQSGRDFTNVSAEGDVNITINIGGAYTNIFAGGLTGRIRGSITGGTAEGDVNIIVNPGNTVAVAFVGGLVGHSWDADDQGPITRSWAKGDVNFDTVGAGNMTYVGGLVGYIRSNVTNSMALGDVVGGQRVGGLIGEMVNRGATNVMAAGNVSGQRYVGGLVGNLNTGVVGAVDASYALGAITRNAGATITEFGQIVGSCGNNNRVTNGTYYNTTSSTVQGGLTVFANCNTTGGLRGITDASMLSPGAGLASFAFECSFPYVLASDWCYSATFAKKGQAAGSFLYPTLNWSDE